MFLDKISCFKNGGDSFTNCTDPKDLILCILNLLGVLQMQCYLIKEIEQMRVGISANNEAKAQLAKLYFEVKINVSKGKEKKIMQLPIKL